MTHPTPGKGNADAPHRSAFFLVVNNHGSVAPHGEAMTSSGKGLSSNSLMPERMRPIAPGARFSLCMALSAMDIFDSMAMADALLKRRTIASMSDSPQKKSWMAEQSYVGGVGTWTCSEYLVSRTSAQYLRIILAKTFANFFLNPDAINDDATFRSV
jgi:hypothetical protein